MKWNIGARVAFIYHTDPLWSKHGVVIDVLSGRVLVIRLDSGLIVKRNVESCRPSKANLPKEKYSS